MKFSLSVAVGNYDRTRALVDGRVRIDGVNPAFMTLSPEEMFFRAFRHADFDITELSSRVMRYRWRMMLMNIQPCRFSCRAPFGTRRYM